MHLIFLAAGLATMVAVAQPSPSFATTVAAVVTNPDRLVLPAAKAGRTKPLVVVVAGKDGAETTDFIIPYGVLKDAAVADVRSLSTSAGPVRLARSLVIVADQTFQQFDGEKPDGADVVIVPAQVAPKDPALLAWIRDQAAKGATVISVCEGARVLAAAGLLDGKQATTHWSAFTSLEKAYPSTRWVRDRSYLQDGAIITTAGVAASVPMSLALIEAIAGHDMAAITAHRIGATGWSADHRTADFALRKGDVSGAVKAVLAFWNHETVEAPIADGVDEVALALRADAWGRSFRSRVATTNPGRHPVRSRHGLQILADDEHRAGRYVIPGGSDPAVAQLDAAIAQMGHRYGPKAARLAMLGMEYAPQTLAAK